uniref:thiamine pyrophosphate-binding protein n=1 Tax=Microbacterium sp. B24 TaxID=95616 RepID=UPI0023BADD54
MSIAAVATASPLPSDTHVATPPTGRRAADRVVDVLMAHGVRWVFGVPGAKIDPVFDALAAVQGVAGAPQLITSARS